MKQFLLHLDETTALGRRFILQDLDATHLFISSDIYDTLQVGSQLHFLGAFDQVEERINSTEVRLKNCRAKITVENRFKGSVPPSNEFP